MCQAQCTFRESRSELGLAPGASEEDSMSKRQEQGPVENTPGEGLPQSAEVGSRSAGIIEDLADSSVAADVFLNEGTEAYSKSSRTATLVGPALLARAIIYGALTIARAIREARKEPLE